jgi:hypothetical protein
MLQIIVPTASGSCLLCIETPGLGLGSVSATKLLPSPRMCCWSLPLVSCADGVVVAGGGLAYYLFILYHAIYQFHIQIMSSFMNIQYYGKRLV